MSDTIKTSTLKGTELILETSYGTKVYDSQFLVAALLIYVARGSGRIEPEESAQMIDLIEEHFQLQGAESLELLTRAMTDLAENPDIEGELIKLAPTLSDDDREDIAVMALKVIAADGHRHTAELEKFSEAVQAIGISPENVHKAFDRYFAETAAGNDG
jgi:uncharacterized tellurite resistance protein B-like protein